MGGQHQRVNCELPQLPLIKMAVLNDRFAEKSLQQKAGGDKRVDRSYMPTLIEAIPRAEHQAKRLRIN